MISTISMAALSPVHAQNEPVIFWASDPVKPDQTIVAQGDLLDGATEVQLGHLPNTAPGKPVLTPIDFKNIESIPLKSLQPSLQTGKYLVPAQWELGIYALRPSRDGHYGKTILINAPEVWWLQGDAVKSSAPGGTYRIFGKCLSFGDGKVCLEGADGAWTTVKVLEQDTWHLVFEVGGLNAGDYTAYVHNGLGGGYGWVEAGRMSVKTRRPWPQKVFSVVDYGARPNFDPKRSILDTTNDSPAFQRALDAAEENGGGVVYVPMGCYRLEEGLRIPQKVTLRGEARLATNLGWADQETPPLALIRGSNSFAVEDLSIFVQNHYSVIMGDHGHRENAGNVAVRRVTIRANRYIGVNPRFFNDWRAEYDRRAEDRSMGRVGVLQFGGENIEISDCDVVCSHHPFILDKASGLVTRNRFNSTISPNAFYSVRGCSNLILTHNDIAGGGGMGTHNTSIGFRGQKDYEVYLNVVSENIYLAHNYYHDKWMWDRELMTLDSHGYEGPYVGPIAEGKGASVVLPDVFLTLSVMGDIMSKSGEVTYPAKLIDGKTYRVVAKMVSKKEAMDWDRCFIKFYENTLDLETVEPQQFDRNGDSRHYAHGKVNAIRVSGKKGFEVQELRISKTWDGLLRESSKRLKLAGGVVLNGEDELTDSTEVLFDFDADGVLYVSAVITAKDPSCTGQVELLKEDGRSALTVRTSRLGGTKVDFSKDPKSRNQSPRNIDLFKGGMVYVLEGRGCGQYRRIVGGSGSTLILDHPWDIALDQTSVISIHRSHRHQIFTNNQFADGGVALQLYGGAIEAIIAENTLTRAGGFITTGLRACPSMYNQFLDNTIVSGAGMGGPPHNLRGGSISVVPYRPRGYLNGYQVIGVVLRGNQFSNLAAAYIAGPVQNVLIEDNAFVNTKTAVIVNSEGMGSLGCSWYWPQDVLMRNNVAKNVESMLKADKEATIKVFREEGKR